MDRITITIDDDLLATVDALAAARGYPSRSEAIREMLRGAARAAHAARDDAACAATLSYVYDHAMRDLPRRIAAIQHDHHDLGIATTHVHFDHETCLEVAILRGPAAAIRRLADALTSQRGVRHVSLHLVPLHHAPQSHAHDAGTAPHTHDHP